MFVNYDESILNYIASIREYYGLESSYAPKDDFSKYLNDIQPERIYLLLIDGMGSRLIQRKLKEDSFIRRHQIAETFTVFPPTTTAATTSILNGKAPNENAWIGWTQYVKEVDDIVVPFYGSSYYGDKKYGKEFFYNTIEVSDIMSELNAKGIKASEIYPAFRKNGAKDFEELMTKMVKATNESDDKFIYLYWDKYDSLMHDNGVTSSVSDDYLNHMNSLLEKSVKELKSNTLLIVVADHGQVDIEEEINIYDTNLSEYLIRPVTCEPRATVFYVKEEYKDIFAHEFKKQFSDGFILLSHEQVLDTHLFGDRENHPRFEEMIGDYIAIAKKHKHLVYQEKPKDKKFKGGHAGCHLDELMIPFIIYYQK